jgi:hypothetical protein
MKVTPMFALMSGQLGQDLSTTAWPRLEQLDFSKTSI